MSGVAQHPTVEELRTIDLFTELDDEQLAQWVEAAELHEQKADGVIYDPDAGPPPFCMLLEGELQILILDRGRLEPIVRQVGPTWLGAIPVLTEAPMAGRMQALTDVRFATMDAEPFIDLVLAHRTVFQRVMRQVRPVANRIAATEQNRERLASLGTMAAGLAHELNNPAAAAQRAASDLADSLDVLSSTVGVFVESGISREQAGELVVLQREALRRRCEQTPLSGLDAADAEDEVIAVLEDLGVSEPWRYNEPLASAGLDRQWLERLAALAGSATPAAVAWVAASISARGLATELAESTARMSKLVKAIKAYAFMDRGEWVQTDIHDGLETTLVVLGHKLKHTEIEIERDYDRSLPKITVGSELNQVWTNLLDNAIGALDERGTITISTQRDGPCIRVDVADDGPGIPEEIQERIFDPFFTTKGVGQGTGLGLDTARRIVQERHHGTLRVESEPGHTVFRVWLPLDGEGPA
jgi:signal transduction histidine kinase